MHNFEVIRVLGNGKKRKFNEVFLVKNKGGNGQAVLKYLKKTAQNVPGQNILRQEAAYEFQHPGLPHTLAFRETEEEIFLLKNYFEGRALDDYWRELAPGERIAFLKRLFEKLGPLFEELREKGLVHGDIKPSNIIVQGKGLDFNVALIDFGLAFYPAAPPGRSLVFALGFSAPELILNRLDLAGHSSDLFSLGISLVLLYEGKLPLSHPNPAVMTNLQLTHPLMQTSRVPKTLFPLIARMCYKQPFPKPPNLMPESAVREILAEGISRRYQSIAEILPELEKVPEEKKKNWFGF